MTPTLLTPPLDDRAMQEIVDDITRRRFVTGGAALAVLLGAGCADGEPDQTQPTTAVRTIESNRGPVEVPIDPRRIVAIDRAALDAALALGFTPIAAAAPEIETSYLGDLVDGIEVISTPDGFDLERIAALEPDLILAIDESFLDDVYGPLSRIAPTAFVGQFTNAGEWREHYELVANVLTQDQARIQRVRDEFDAKVAQARTAIGDVSATTAQIFNPYTAEAYLYLRDSFCGQLLAEVGFAASTSESATGFVDTLSYEQVGNVDADVVFVLVGEDDADAARFDELTASPLWQRLPAPTAGTVIEVPFYWLVNGYLSAGAILDDLASYAAQIRR